MKANGFSLASYRHWVYSKDTECLLHVHCMLVTSTLSIVHAAKLVCYPWMVQGMASNYACEECEGISLYI